MNSFRIKGAIKEYAWGTADYISELTGISTDSQIAEYWLGTHYLGQSHCDDGTLLSDRIGHSLPFLFKILSINTPLAIQSHPTKRQAREGFYRELALGVEGELRNYPDVNDKTEAFLALSQCFILYGFKPVDEIRRSFGQYLPNTHHLLGPWNTIRDLYQTIFSLNSQKCAEILSELRISVAPYENKKSLTSVNEILNRCTGLYPDDISNLFPLMMNFLEMKPGQCVFIRPNLVHAYCFGNGIEIMSSSDNMVRLGLTKRPTDVKEFSKISILDPSDAFVCKTESSFGCLEKYIFPQGAFSLCRIIEGTGYSFSSSDSVLFVVDGVMTVKETDGSIILEKGEAVFIPAGTPFTVVSKGLGFIAGGC